MFDENDEVIELKKVVDGKFTVDGVSFESDIIESYSVSSYISVELKEDHSTKQCPFCGNTSLVLFKTFNQKICMDRGRHISNKPVRIFWDLDKNQKSLL